MMGTVSASSRKAPGVSPRASRPLVAAEGGRLATVGDPLRATLFLLTVVTISRVHQHYPVLAKFRPALLLVLAAVGYVYLNPRYLTRANVLRFWPMRLVAALGLLACCSAAFGISLGGSALFILDSYVKTLVYVFLIALSIRHARDLFTFVWAYVMSCGVLSFFSIFVFGITKVRNTYVTRLNNMYTYDSNDLGVVMMVGLPLTLLLLTVERDTKKRGVLLLILVGISATMARSGSRGGFLGFVAVAAAALMLVNGVSAARRLFVLAAGVVTLAFAAPPGYWIQIGTIMKPKADYNYYDRDGRKAVMERGIGYMIRYPAFGIGIANFNRAECTISPKLATLQINGPMRCTAPHNSYVQAGAELGIPGLLIWGSLVVGLIVAPLRLRRRLPRSWLRGTDAERFVYTATSYFAVASIGFAVTSFFVSFAWMDTVYFMAALLTGLYVAVQAQFSAADSSTLNGRSKIASSGAVAGWRVRQSAWRSRISGLS